MKDNINLAKVVSGIKEQVISALDSKLECIVDRLDYFEQTLNSTLEAIAERQYTEDARDDIFEDE